MKGVLTSTSAGHFSVLTFVLYLQKEIHNKKSIILAECVNSVGEKAVPRAECDWVGQ